MLITAAAVDKKKMTGCICSKSLLNVTHFPSCPPQLTCPRTAAAFGTAGAAEVTATRVRAALTPTDSNKQQQQQEAKNHQDN